MCTAARSNASDRISLRRSIEHFSSRVVQLERFIVANGLSVPPPLGADRALAIDELMATFSSRADDAGHSSPTDSTETAPGRGPQEEPAALSIDDQEDGVPGPGTGWLAPQAQMSDMFGSGMGPTLPGLEFDDMALSSEMAQAPGFFDDFSFAFDTDMTGTAALMDMPFVMGPHPTESSHGDLPVSAGLNAGSDSDIVQDMDGHSDVTDEISDRMGRLLAAKGGGWRYYGATSNLHLAQTRHIVDLAAKKSITDVLLAARLETLGLAHALPDDLICHLTRLYFTWHNPSLQIVDQRAFEQAQKAQPKDQTFYSEVLMNAICALGAALDDRRHPGLPSQLSELFAKRAKAILELELEEPRVATVQGLAILSCHEAAMTRDTMAWVFSGMAVRLAFDLGLHAATRSYVEEGVMNEDEARSRSNTFWGVFINDNVLSLNLGRPFHTNIDEIAAEKPKCSSIDQHSDIWIAYTQPEDTTKSMDQASNPKSSLLYSWIALHEIMCALDHSLYARKDVPKLELQILAEKTFERLLAFKSNLPPDMALTQESLDHVRCVPHLITLQSVYSSGFLPFCTTDT
ncbi:hypothetical protein LTR56_017169 [Elasticomyces elasticus]|nr:hypothetical protein LTR56_017169 [Elasticomyces elasticus]KAK3666285.1 hypothetical protein LTR22_002949 [Elasticomyces elasticus]KAK4926881.1 hypothetical protein LTR49_006297 [Elasticomyces elasticus]KAK5752688.1 hypothetical protein LTS12_017257 [Elasticomyces elasticus]